MRNAISSFLLPDFKPVHGSENLNTERPLTLERIAAESRKPKNAANWDVHYFKKMCNDLGIKVDDIQNAEALLSDDKQFILENLEQLPSTHLVKIPSHSIPTYRPINEAKQIILSQHSFSTLKNRLNASLVFAESDKKYFLLSAVLTLSLTLSTGVVALYLGAGATQVLLLVCLTLLKNASFLYMLYDLNYENLQFAYNHIPPLIRPINEDNRQQGLIMIASRRLNSRALIAMQVSSIVASLARGIAERALEFTPIGSVLWGLYASTEVLVCLYVSSFHLINTEKAVINFHCLGNLIYKDNVALNVQSIESTTKYFIEQNKKAFDFCVTLITIAHLCFYAFTFLVFTIKSFVLYGCSISVVMLLLFAHLILLLYNATSYLLFTGFSFGYAQNLNNLQKDYKAFFKDIVPIAQDSSQLSADVLPSNLGSNTIDESIDINKVFKLLLPYFSQEDKKNIRLCSRDMNNIIRENTHFFNMRKTNICAVEKVFPYTEKIKINSSFFPWDISNINDTLSSMQHLTAIEMNLSESKYIDFWRINLAIRQKITHLTCYGHQIVNIPIHEQSSCFPQLTHLTVLNPKNRNFEDFICNSTLLPALKYLEIKQKADQPTLQQLAWPHALHELKLEGLSNEELPEFPRFLTNLTLVNLRELKKTPKLPRYLIYLYLSHLDSLTELVDLDIGQFPEFITTLSLIHLRHINSIPPFPKNLTSFSFASSQRMNEQELFTERLTSFLSVTRLMCLNAQRQFSPSLTSLDIDTPDFKIQIRPENHPDTL